MAYRGPSYGLSRQCQMKTLAKFDIERARLAIQWIEDIIEEPLTPSSMEVRDQFDVRDALKDGESICRVMNDLFPGVIKKINTSKIAFKRMENIEMFLTACRTYGMKEVDCFQTQDLYEAKSMYSVINCIYALGSLAQRNGYSGPTIGVKLADENIRQFSQETLQAGKCVINLQYGTAAGASQRGMTPYGATRKM